MTVADNGTATFEGTNTGGAGNVATNTYDGTADVTVVDGVAVTGPDGGVEGVDSSDGSVSFTVANGTAGECYVPVVFADADEDGRVDLDGNDQPTEEFGVGAETTIVADEADAGALAAQETVDFVSLADDLFSTEGGTYYYDSNDEFVIAGATPAQNETVTMAEFEQVLSVDDTLEAGSFYRDTAAGQSVFILDDVAPDAPGAIAQQNPSGDNEGEEGVEITWGASTDGNVVSYTVYRDEATQPTVTGGTIECSDDLADFTRLGSVDADDDLLFFDGTAEAPETTGDMDPAYCYAVVAVDETGDVSDATFGGPFEANAATPANEAPVFDSAAAVSGVDDTVTLTYSEAVDDSTIDGSEYEVRVTDSDDNVTNVTAQAVVSTGATADDAVVVLTLPGTAFDAGDTVRVDVVNGTTDEDTVADLDEVFQPLTDAVIDVAE